jgi:hypothetical protein
MPCTGDRTCQTAGNQQVIRICKDSSELLEDFIKNNNAFHMGLNKITVKQL